MNIVISGAPPKITESMRRAAEQHAKRGELPSALVVMEAPPFRLSELADPSPRLDRGREWVARLQWVGQCDMGHEVAVYDATSKGSNITGAVCPVCDPGAYEVPEPEPEPRPRHPLSEQDKHSLRVLFYEWAQRHMYDPGEKGIQAAEIIARLDARTERQSR
jgi:hypothetical protein